MPLLEIRNLARQTFLGIWHITENTEQLLSQLPDYFSYDEFQLIRNEKKKVEWLASRLLLYKVVQEFSTNPFKILKEETGKPYLEGNLLHISISHSPDYAAVIVSENHEVGIDIEVLREKVIALAPKFLSDHESMDAGSDVKKLNLYWSSKETLYKMYGKKRLLFKEHILIKPFDMRHEGQVFGTVSFGTYRKQFEINYEFINSDNVITFCLDN